MQFLLNQQLITVSHLDPNMTVLNYLREEKQRCGTKEGCASGDCGACTVVVASLEEDNLQYQTVNSCLTLVSALHGKQLITVEDLQDRQHLHPVQQAMVDNHASQCGFCTPGFVMSLFALMKHGGSAGHTETEQALAGNLCRCTGYHPILQAASDIMRQETGQDQFLRYQALTKKQLNAIQTPEIQILQQGERIGYLPQNMTQLAGLCQLHPDAVLVAGGTDLSLAITQSHQRFPVLVALSHVPELKQCYRQGERLFIGAGASLTTVAAFLAQHIPATGAFFTRFASLQIRNQGTVGGNLANASPIGDCAPMLLAMDAQLILQCGEQQRHLPLEEFFTGYRQTRLRAGEFIRSVIIPSVTLSQKTTLHKVSKRIDDDISAVFAAITISANRRGRTDHVRVAFGGMAATPCRAYRCEAVLSGQVITTALIEQACAALSEDFQPLSDFRASAGYRRDVAANLLRRWYFRYSDPSELTEITDYVS